LFLYLAAINLHKLPITSQPTIHQAVEDTNDVERGKGTPKKTSGSNQPFFQSPLPSSNYSEPNHDQMINEVSIAINY